MQRKQLSIRLRELMWLIEKNSLENKMLIYKAILKPYGVQLWGVAAQSDIDIIQRFQSKVLGIIHNDLGVPTVQEK